MTGEPFHGKQGLKRRRSREPMTFDQAVYDGREKLGDVRRFGDHYVARLADGKRLGNFPSAAAAFAAIRDAIRGAPDRGDRP